MAAKKEWAPIGLDPIDADTAYGIQSKAVGKYTDLIIKVAYPHIDIFLFLGVEAVGVWN